MRVYSDCFWTETFFPIEKVEVQNLRKVWKHTRFTCSPGGHRSGKWVVRKRRLVGRLKWWSFVSMHQVWDECSMMQFPCVTQASVSNLSTCAPVVSTLNSLIQQARCEQSHFFGVLPVWIDACSPLYRKLSNILQTTLDLVWSFIMAPSSDKGAKTSYSIVNYLFNVSWLGESVVWDQAGLRSQCNPCGSF